MHEVVVNALGEACPRPVVKAVRAREQMGEAGVLEVHVDNETAVQNLSRMAAGRNLPAQTRKEAEKHYVVRITVADPKAAAAPLTEPPMACAPAAGGFVAAVDTAVMGRGDDTLGKTLMKGFLYAVSQLPQPPETMLFYNGGAFLTTEGSESLEDLRRLEEKGTEILTCGTCLNHYGLTEKLAVGKVTNMYEIVEKLAGAARVIKP